MEDRYPPLDKEQERALIKKYRKNREKLNHLLMMHNLRIVFNIAKKYKSKTDDFDGIIQDGFVGLGEAAKRFDINRGTKFITHAYIWVRKYVLSSFYAKNIEVDRNSTSLSTPCASSKSDKSKAEFADIVNQFVDPSCTVIKGIDEEISADEQTEICDGMMQKIQEDNSLSSTDKLVFVDLFYNKEKTRDIADKYDLTTTEIHEIRDRVLGKCRNILASDYAIQSYDEIRC